MTARLARLAKEPLVHFFLLGLGIFVAFEVLRAPEVPPDEIVVRAGQVERLAAGFRKTWRRTPTEAEMAGLIDDHIREEVLYREAIALGLDRGDTIVRRRLRQKVEFLAADLAAGLEQPTDAELQSYLDENAEAFLIEPEISFRQIYLSADRRGAAAARDEAAHLNDRLNNGGRNGAGAIDTVDLGDPFPLAPAYEDLPMRDVTALFGREFARQIATTPTGRWVGPVDSGYGVHVVFVDNRTEARVPKLAEVRDAVLRELSEVRRRSSGDEFYERLRARYTIVVERPEGASPELARADDR